MLDGVKSMIRLFLITVCDTKACWGFGADVIGAQERGSWDRGARSRALKPEYDLVGRDGWGRAFQAEETGLMLHWSQGHGTRAIHQEQEVSWEPFPLLGAVHSVNSMLWGHRARQLLLPPSCCKRFSQSISALHYGGRKTNPKAMWRAWRRGRGGRRGGAERDRDGTEREMEDTDRERGDGR